MPTLTIRYGGPVPVVVPAWGLDLQPGQVVTLTLDEEAAAHLLADPSGDWTAVDPTQTPAPAAQKE